MISGAGAVKNILAEAGISSATGAVPMELSDSYGQFAHLHLSTHGVIR